MKLVVCVLAILAVAKADNADLETIFKKGVDNFSNQLFLEVVNEAPSKNVIMSAFSVMTPLALLSLASTGESHDELLKSMGIPNDNFTETVFPLVNRQLQVIKGIDLKMANKIYIAQNYKLNDSFAVYSRDVFGSEVKNIDFTKTVESAKEINGWVEDQTNKRIKDLVNAKNLFPDTRALLVNAIYFKGLWENKFSNRATVDRDFHISKEKTIKLPTMNQQNDFKYISSKELDCQILEIPYEGAEASLVILLPKEIDGLPSLEQKLKNLSLLENAMKKMVSFTVQVFLPKFKIETTINLKNILSKIGVQKIFEAGKANLYNLLKTRENLSVTQAIQKAFIEVNEQGTEAAAANDVSIAMSSSYNPNVAYFDANHPFMFILKQKDYTLFTGVFTS